MFSNKKGSWDCDDANAIGKSQEPILRTMLRTMRAMSIDASHNVASAEEIRPHAHVREGGMGYWLASFFLVAQMAGAGFLALPKSLANTGWSGLAMLLIFGVLVSFSGTRLSKCWVILEERWPEYRKPNRQPYMACAERAFGKPGRAICLAAILLTLGGASIVFMILIAQFLSALIPSTSTCLLLVIVGAVLIPLTWPGTPKDFWQASVIAVVSTFLACAVIFVELILDRDNFPNRVYESPSVESFFLGFGTILFAFGGASAFPTIQNDMKHRAQFKKSVLIAFAALMGMYLPVTVGGYIILGQSTPNNILLYSGEDLSLATKIAIGCEIFNLIPTFLVAFNPVCQCVEDLIGIPHEFGVKRCLNRSILVVVGVATGLALPHFDLILNLVGSSTITITSFLLPSAMYLKLASQSKNIEKNRQKVILERLVLCLIMVIGVIGGATGTFYAAKAIVTTPFGTSCYAEFIHMYKSSINGTEETLGA